MNAPLISVVVPMFNEGDACDVFFQRVIPVLEQITDEFEIVCVDDGSTDSTYEKLGAAHRQDPRVKLIRLTRNFGKEAALSAGLDHASGRAVIPIDADLQDPPELIPEMVRLWRDGRYDSVVAVRSSREEDGLFKRSSAGMFYRVASRLFNVPMQANAGDFRLLDRKIVEALRALPERTRFMKGLYAWVGANSATIGYSRPARAAGTSKWNAWGLWNFALDGIFSFSTIPLRIWTYVGATVAGLSAVYGAIIIFRTIVQGVDVPGYASLLVVVLFMGGLNLIGLGILGEYIGRIFIESKCRPLYLVSEVVGGDTGPRVNSTTDDVRTP